MKYLLSIVCLGIFSNCIANSSLDCNKILSESPKSHFQQDKVDIHGLEDERAQLFLNQYNQTIQNLEIPIMSEFIDMNQGQLHPHRMQCLMERKKRWLANIKNSAHFAFVDLQTVYYPATASIYTTMEVIEDPNDQRMRFVPVSTNPFFTEFKLKLNRIRRGILQNKDVIDSMQEFDALDTQLLLNHQLDNDTNDCPAYHCLSSFRHPQLKPYFTLFQQGVLQDKPWIVTTLRHDPDPERRAAAAFLVGHFSDPKEIITLLSGSIDDPASQVRNNALRVITTTLFKTKLNTIDCTPFIKLLDSPYVTDRNKALNILITLADDALCASQIRQDATHALSKLVLSTQPNNHDEANALIKKLKKSLL